MKRPIRLQRSALAVGVLAMLLGLPSSAQSHAERTLYWRELAVRATLDADGRLHVREEHAMVFDGAWNGGERLFHVRPRERVRLEGLYRRDDATGELVALRPGNLDAVDHYRWADLSLRWRSRLPSDPPFENREIVYVLDYVLSGALRSHDGLFRLDHDFAFPNREGAIQTFTLDLGLDPVWQPRTRLPGTFSAGPLAPGRSFLVTADLAYGGAGSPSAVVVGLGLGFRLALAGGLIALTLLSLGLLLARERRIGRFAALRPLEQIDASWLQDVLFRHPPEVVGAAWDNRVGQHEVAAVLARLEAEGKLSSRVAKGGFLRAPELHLECLVPRSSFHGYESKLIDALFLGSDTTSTSRVRKAYKQTGFNPVAKIKSGVERRARQIGGGRALAVWPSWKWSLALLGLAVLSTVVGAILQPADLAVGGVCLAATLGLMVLGTPLALWWRQRVHYLAESFPAVLLPCLGLTATPIVALLLSGVPLGAATALALVLLAASAVATLCNVAASRESSEHIARRKDMAAGREYLAEELRKQSPALDDAWFPYLVALGLGSAVDRWVQRFAVAIPGASSATLPSTGSSVGSWSSGGASGTAFTGGGGHFGGAGASAAWAAAASGLAAGVAAPSSSGGGGGGGGSSGGGGGGGW